MASPALPFRFRSASARAIAALLNSSARSSALSEVPPAPFPASSAPGKAAPALSGPPPSPAPPAPPVIPGSLRPASLAAAALPPFHDAPRDHWAQPPAPP